MWPEPKNIYHASEEKLFSNSLAFAKDIAAEDPAGLTEFRRLLCLGPTVERMTRLVSGVNRGNPGPHWTDHVWDLDHALPREAVVGGREAASLYFNTREEKLVHLGRDPIVSAPRIPMRLKNAFAHIGQGRRDGPWQRSPHNHLGRWWVPLNFATVSEGHHSAARGILTGEGEIMATVTDCSEAVKLLGWQNGLFYCRETGVEIGGKASWRLGVLWELAYWIMESKK